MVLACNELLVAVTAAATTEEELLPVINLVFVSLTQPPVGAKATACSGHERVRKCAPMLSLVVMGFVVAANGKKLHVIENSQISTNVSA